MNHSFPQLAEPMRAHEAFLQADDGVELFVRRFEPLARNAERSLLLVHGMSEHGQCYDHVVPAAVARGWNVIIPDLRGHGRSGGEHIHVNDFGEYVADLGRVYEWAGLAGETTVLVGHSMGGLISARFVQQNADRACALALMSPLLGIRLRISRLTIALARVLAVVRPLSRFQKKIDPAYSSRNPDALSRGAQDPLIRQSLTAAWYFAMRSALRAAWASAEQIACPLLVLQGGSDLIVDPDAPRAWIERVASSDKTLRIFPDHFHELLNEVDWPNTLADLLDWCELRVRACDGGQASIPLREIA